MSRCIKTLWEIIWLFAGELSLVSVNQSQPAVPWFPPPSLSATHWPWCSMQLAELLPAPSESVLRGAKQR